MTLGPNEDGNTWPNTDTYQRGIVKKTGIKITVLSNAGFIMMIKVEGIPDGGRYTPEFVPIDPSDSDGDRESGGLNKGEGPIAGIHPVGDEEVNTTGRTLAWILSVLSGVAVILGALVLFF